MTISEAQHRAIHDTAVKNGFWDFLRELDGMLEAKEITQQDYDELSFIFYGKQFMMIASEVTETMEAVRKSKGADKIAEEFADIYIRMVDLYEGMKSRGIVSEPLAAAIGKKIDVNNSRERLHGVKG